MGLNKQNLIFKLNAFPQVSETFVVNSIIEAIESRNDVMVVTDILNSLRQSSQLDLINKYRLLDKTLVFEQPKDKSRRMNAFLKLCLHPVYLFFYLKFYQSCKKRSLDYVFYLNFYKKYRAETNTFHVHFATALEPLLVLKRIGFLKGKIIVTFHGYDAHYLPHGEMLNELTNNYKKYVDHITVNSIYLKNVLLNKGFPEVLISIVPIGVDVSFFRRSKPKVINQGPGLKLITVGRLIPLKGQRYGIKAVKNLIEKGLNLHYTIVGDGTDLVLLKQLAKELNIEDYISFTGAKSQQEIKHLLEDHDVFIMPSTHDKSGRREAFGVVSLEAQAMGLPVIAFNSGGVVDTLVDKQTGFVVNDRDVEGISKKIEELYNNPKVLSVVSNNAIEHINSNFNLKQTNKGYLKLY
ncbi:colanic acid biosynthesis glycosyltransferase WcaL [Tamlana haliotis]|uniref:Colanic acid biosynthesis glycosyltransferase WcaL n=1 Tax=Pseudotamlana haliotis TaxID=2614804 RepID=A0A6N6M9R5_9FLAO|nr:glycosyltransferase [Tamlana haliotis]KAB1067023.1 colanic acid biosynthesis glycosyltransferase WcaL [Tamlana haliotis]